VATPVFADEFVDFLALLTSASQRRLLEHSRQVEAPAGSAPMRPGDPRGAFLVRQGLIRSFWGAPDGRETTIAFIYPGNLVGAPLLVPGAAGLYEPFGSVGADAVVNSTLTLLDLETARRVVSREIEVVSALATVLAAFARYSVRRFAVGSLGNIPERLAFDLLERASRSQLYLGRLDARATHQDLADSIGSSREAVSRALKGLRAAGIVETAPGLTRVLDPIRLANIVRTYLI
jgi:CRP/FNR family transcriptional regulator, cyclic AMP receptor protein